VTSTYITKKNIELPEFFIPEYHSQKLSNGILIKELPSSGSELIRIDLVFAAGKAYSNNPLLASACFELMAKGTASWPTNDLARVLDETGAIIDLSVSSLYSAITIILIKDEVPVMMPLISEILTRPSFDEKNIENYKSSSLQSYRIQRMRTSVLAREAFLSNMFGEDHPHGRILQENDILSINKDQLLEYHKNHILDNTPEVFICGADEDEKAIIVDMLSGLPATELKAKLPTHTTVHHDSLRRVHQTLESASQTSLYAGLSIPGRNHPDYAGLTLLNTIAGGYFSSRLMSNLREDKGYTYGIGSSLSTGKLANYMLISAELGSDYLQDSINEIFNEFEILKNDLVEQDELNTARNYLFGSLLRSMDGPFSQQNILVDLNEHGLDFDWLKMIRERLMSLSVHDIRNLAQKYLNINNMVIASCGPQIKELNNQL
jgi:zinc protease